MLHEHFFSDRASMLQALQSALTLQLQHDLQNNEQVSLFLSGGTTPGPLYRALAHTALPWQRVNVALVDERFVPVADEASNEKLIRETLLLDHAASAGFTGMSVSSSTQHTQLSTLIQACNENYARLPHPYSAALLGMGADGHTASLFPHAVGLQEAFTVQQPCAAIHALHSPDTKAVTERISMTPWALLQCRCLYLLFTGNDKKVVYEQAKIASDHHTLPLALFLQQQKVPVAVYWCP
jgi:6-phosphogluconolactonase